MTLATTHPSLWARIRLPLAAVFFLVAAVLIFLGSRPVKLTAVEFPLLVIQPENEQRTLEVEWPTEVGLGQAAPLRVRLSAETLATENQPAELLTLKGIYQGSAPRLEARLDLPGVDLQPPGTLSQPLVQGEQAAFFWRLKPQRSGPLEGTLWLYLTGPAGERQTLLARNISIQSRSLFGLRPGRTRWIGYGFFVLALALGIDAIGRALARPGRSQ